jgi:hypothetical protein
MLLSLFFRKMETIGSIIKDEIIPQSISIKKRKKKRTLTNREKLWKQVNKKVKKITYTLNPNSHFYEDETQVVCNDFVPDRGYDDDSFQWAEVASNIDWTGLLSLTRYFIDIIVAVIEENKVHVIYPTVFFITTAFARRMRSLSSPPSLLI